MVRKASSEQPTSAVAGSHRGLFITLFGHLDVEVDGRPFTLAARRKALPLLAYLLLHRHENPTRDFLAFLLWPDESEEDARTKLRSTIHELTRALPPDDDVPWLLITSGNLRWNPAAPLDLDVERFEAAANDPERLDEARDLYRDDLLKTLEDEWIVAERERLQQLFYGALERGIARASRAGDLTRALAYGRQLLARDPFREDILRRVMALRDASGDRSGALDEYRKFESHIRRELGVDPMPETLAFREQIARGEAVSVAGDAGDDVQAPWIERGGSEYAPLVGRDAELARLEAIWSRTRGRRGNVVFVGGEAGIGKSRLVAHFANEVVHAGGRVIVGGTSAPEAGPYQSLVESFRSALPLVAALRLEPIWKSVLATLVPELAADGNGAPAALPTLAGNAQADRVHEAAGRALVALAATRPLVVILEDLHWSSSATVEALRALARRIALEPILILVSYRDDELERSHPLAVAIRQVERDRLGETLPLGPLALEHVVELARKAGFPSERAAAIHRVTAGNAFFVGQLLASDAQDAAVPDGVFEAVTARFERLPETARHVAEIAAVAGSYFSRELLCDVAGWNATEVRDALDVLIERRFVRERPSRGPFNLGFAHELVRRTILGIAPGSPDRHRRVARVIETCYPELAGELALELAAHYERAEAPLEAAKWYAHAARRALDLGAPLDAAAALASALRLEIDLRTRAELQTLAVEAGSRGEIETQLAQIERLEELATQLGEEELRITGLMARLELSVSVAERRGIDEAAAVVRARARADGDSRRLAIADMADAFIGMHTLEASHRRDLLTSALTTFRELGDQRSSARCLGSLCTIAVRAGAAADVRRITEELQALANASADYRVKILSIVSAYTAITEFGFGDDCLALSARWIALAKGAGDLREETRGRENHARSLLLAGRGAGALESMLTAVEVARSIGSDGPANSVMVNYATLLTKLGAFARSIPILESIVEYQRNANEIESYRSVSILSALSLALAYDGSIGRAREIAFEARTICDRLHMPIIGSVLLENLAEIERLAGDYDAAFAFAEGSLAVRTSYRVGGRSKSIISAALAAARAGRLDAASGYLARIGDDEREVFEGTYWRERTALELAQAAHLCGDDARASRWLAIAEREVAASTDGLDEPWRSHYRSAWWSRDIAAAREGRWPPAGRV